MQPRVSFPKKLQFLFKPMRYKVLYGGRGSGKSWNIARYLVLKAAFSQRRVLCVREFQVSMKDSVHKLLCDQIEALNLERFYTITDKSIEGKNGSEFIFAGIRTNPEKIKSTEGVTDCWVEEAEKVSDPSWRMLIPTIRKDGSEILISFNPDLETDPTYQRFVINPPPNAIVVLVNWSDNPWFPKVLEDEKAYDYSVDPENAANVWGGETRKNSKSAILGDKVRVEEFEPKKDGPDRWDGPYFGLDYGYSQDPLAGVKMWIHDRVLYVEDECGGVGIENDAIAAELDKMDDIKRAPIYADAALPATTSQVKRMSGLLVQSADKWPGSVEDGIKYLRSFRKIIVHPRCVHTEKETRLYSYRVDRLTQAVTTDIVDKWNHWIDAMRYGLCKMIRKGRSVYDSL